jgi:hypothetical protein
MVRQGHGTLAILAHTKQRHARIGKQAVDLPLPEPRMEEHCALNRHSFSFRKANLNQCGPFPEHATYLMGQKFVTFNAP